MKRFGGIAVLAAFASGAHAVVLFSDGFESGNLSKWTAAAATGTVTVQNTVVHSGSFAAQTSGTVGSRAFASLSRPEIPGEIVTLDFWMKLDGTSPNMRHYAELRGHLGGTYSTAAGQLQQLYAIGAWNGAVVNGTANTNKWQARITFNQVGGPTVAGWYTLTEAPDRTTEWTNFQVALTQNTIQFYVNGIAGFASPLDRGNRNPVDTLIMGSNLTSANIDAQWDDFNVTAVPEPGTMIALGLGALGLVARRRRNQK